jgi:hypothetical protein
MPGGEDWYADQDRFSPERRAVGVDEARIALDAVDRGEDVEYLNRDIPRRDGKGTLTEVDVETTNEMIQVKGGDYTDAKKLRKEDVTQWQRTKMYNEQMRFDDKGEKLPPKKLVFHFTGGASDAVKKWCRDRDIEPREGRP